MDIKINKLILKSRSQLLKIDLESGILMECNKFETSSRSKIIPEKDETLKVLAKTNPPKIIFLFSLGIIKFEVMNEILEILYCFLILRKTFFKITLH